MVDNNLDKYTIIVEEQDNYTIELNGQGPQGARGPIGPQGIQGERGEKGEQGDIGPANTLTVGSVTKGEDAEVIIEGESPNQTINFVLPKGDKGDKGDQGIQGIQGVQGIQGEVGPVGPQGKAATITIGEVRTGEPNTQASVTNVGTSTDSILNFSIPRGYKGEAATIVVGSTTTSEPGTEANVVNSGDENMAILEFTIPKGEKGDKGDTGEQGQQGIQGLTGPRGPQGLKGVSVTGVEQISKVGLVATYRMSFSDGTHFDYEVTDGSVEGVTREQVISLIGYEPASYTSVEGLTTRVSTLEERVEDLTASRANVSLNNLDEVGEKRFTDIQTALGNKQDKGNYALKSEIPTKISQLTDDSTFVHKSGNETISGTKIFSSTISGSVNGSAESSKFLGNHNEIASSSTSNIPSSGMAKPSGLFLTGTYKDSATPVTYGNIINIAGNGTGQLLCEWSGIDNTTGNVYYRSHRDTSSGGWGTWEKLAFTTDNVASATKATQDGNGNNIVNTYATKTSLNAKADTSLSNITDAGKQVIKDNSGGWNPPLLSSFWADHLLNRMDMLRADTFSWQDGTTYSSVYNELLSEYNNSASTTKTDGNITYKLTPKGYKIALASQETAILNKYNSDGIAWYYILDNGDNTTEGGDPAVGNTTNKRFKLPRAKHPSLVSLTSTAPVVGNGMTLGLTNGTVNVGFIGTTNGLTYGSGNYGTNVGSAFSGSSSFNGTSIGITTDPTKSGIVIDLSSNVKDYNMYLYFYVGNFTESAESQTAGLNSELLNGKADISTPSIQAPYLKDTYVNGTSGYRVWSDGYCEQWGTLTKGTSGTLTFIKKYKIQPQVFFGAASTKDGASQDRESMPNQITVNNFTYYNVFATGYNAFPFWRAIGYLAEGEY